MESKKFEDLYEVLDIDFGSSKSDINNKYKEKIDHFKKYISEGNSLDEEQKWEVKLLKIARYVLTDDKLRKKYNVSRIIMDSDDSNDNNIEEDSEPKESNSIPQTYKYTELSHFDVPLRKDKQIDLKEIADRQFERYDHKSFDLSKDRQLRGPT